MRKVSLRRRLLLLALVGIIPLAATSGIGLLVLVKQQRVQTEQTGLAITRALATAVDAALSESISVLEALATSVLLDSGDPSAFHARASRVMAVQPDWILIHLADLSGTELINTTYPIGLPIPPVPERESFDTVVKTQKPTVGHLSRGPQGDWGVPVRVPVIRNGVLRFVLTGIVKPDAFRNVVDRQKVPSDWVVSVFDAKGLRVARTRGHEKYIGTLASTGLQELMASGSAEGGGTANVLEGDLAYSAYTRSRYTNWSVAIGIPLSFIDAGAYGSLAIYGGGILLSLAFAVVAALIIARSINSPVRALADATRAPDRNAKLVKPTTDIREIDDLANALIASAEAAESAHQLADKASRTKDEFLAILGHELRNPLAPIVTALHLMALRSDKGSERERQIIERQVTHLSRLVDDLLDISRITRGKIELNRELVDVKAIFGRALELTQPVLQERDRPVEVDVPLRPVHVSGDALRLTQVLCNLLTNAARHTPRDGRISLQVREAGAMVEMTVEDTGTGISPDLLPRVFDIFIQGQQGIDRRYGGLGLGLAIVKSLVELHGGTVSAASKGLNKGSIFVVRIPKANEAALIGPESEIKGHPTMQTGGRILVVDDNLDAAETLTLLLQSVGHEVRYASNAEGALAIIESFRPEVAVLDIGLPEVDGYELARRLRADLRNRKLKLIALTGYGSNTDVERAMKSGFDDHIVKPAELEHLLEVIAKLLDSINREIA